MNTSNIPNCIAWAISQLMGNCLEVLKPQTSEIYAKNLCSATQMLIYNSMTRKIEILEKIYRVMPSLNLYYDKESYIWTNEKYKNDIDTHKKNIDEFVKWLRGLKGWNEEILNIHDWTY